MDPDDSSGGFDSPAIETWRCDVGSIWWAVPSAVFMTAWIGGLVVFLGMALLEQNWGGAAFAAALIAFGSFSARSGVRQFTSWVELHPEGLSVVNFFRAEQIRWADVAGVEIDDVEFPNLRGRGPCLRLRLSNRRRVPLWATEQLGWGYLRRSDNLDMLAAKLRRLRTEDQNARSRPSPPPAGN